jgi:signal transduction histidine kinase
MAGILKYRYLTEQISKDIKILDKAFKEAPITYEFMDETKVAFVEFKEISSHANKMIAKIREKNYDLMRLNTNLEKIVQEKTGALQRSNDYTKELLKQQDRFVNNAIHEINTPLTIIMMNIELHNLKMPKSAYLTKIEAAAKVLENIYEDLGYVVKKNHKPYPKEKLHMSQFLQERMAYFHDVAEGNDVAFEAYVVPDVWIYFSPVELQRIVDNNLSNAIKYATNKSTIEVSLHVKSTEVEFKVTNMGKPIQKPEKLFERYYREDQVRGGFGLGLNIVKEICEANDVAIEVVSKEGKTSFIYTFNAKEGV